MKKIIFLAVLIVGAVPCVFSQCTEPAGVPYILDAENAAVPALPDCTFSGYLTFASHKIFETTAGPVQGFSGNVFVYDTTLSDNMPDGVSTAVTLTSGPVALVAGTSYELSFNHGMSLPDGLIGIVRTMLSHDGEYIYLPEDENVASGTTPSVYTTDAFTVDEDGAYYFTIEFHLMGGQDYLYLDDISLRESGALLTPDVPRLEMAVYPNPAADVLYINNPAPLEFIKLYTLTGQLLYHAANAEPFASIPVSGLEAGVYILQAGHNGKAATLKVVKN